MRLTSALLTAALVLSCTDAGGPDGSEQCPAPTRPTTIAVTSPNAGLWLIRVDSEPTGTIYGLGGAAPLDTARIPADSTLIYGFLLDSKGFVRCHDWHRALPGDVVVLRCAP